MATKTGLPTTKEEALLILLNRKTPQALTRNGEDEFCTYSHSVNGGCAVGQMVTKNQAEIMECEGNVSVSTACMRGHLPKRLSKLGLEFLVELQNVHDRNSYWNDSQTGRLINNKVWNTDGLDAINKIILDYRLDLPLIKLKS
jgi:hypothetical protein